MKQPSGNILRTALYLRVSTEEQVLHGSSLQAQQDALIEFAKDHNMKIVGTYRDEGFSARKPALTRPAMQALLADVQADKVDRIIFTKLDRWFRNVREYHIVQAVLDKHHVTWQAVLEDYSTASADGRFKTNIMLSVAENEADRTSERIKFVFDSRIQKKEAPFSSRVAPFGYKVELIDGVRRMVKDEEKREITEYFFKMAAAHSIRVAAKEANAKFGLRRAYTLWHRMAINEAYTGVYHGVTDFCEPYITKEVFDQINNNQRGTRKAQNNRTYVFSGLIKCNRCGRRMNGKYTTSRTGDEYMYYRCSQTMVGACDNHHISEKKLEKHMLENLRPILENIILEAEVTPAAPKKSNKPDPAKLQERLRRVNVSYHAGNMTDDEYLAETKEIKAAIEAAQQEEEPQAVDVEALRALLSTDFEAIYITLTKEERRLFWRATVDEIVLDNQKVISVKPRA